MRQCQGPDQDVYRAVSIRYFKTAFSPKGARLRAGRFNRTGTATLYVSLEAETALSEYHRGDPPRPCVLVAARLSVKHLVDLRQGTSDWTVHWQRWENDWQEARDRVLAGHSSADCESWQCGDDAIARNFAGIIYPSRLRSGGSNLAVFLEDAPTGTVSLTPIDPLEEIPAAFPPKPSRRLANVR